jgi:hypothetical protein
VSIAGKPEGGPEVIGLVDQDNSFPKPFDPNAVIDRLNSLVG